MLPNSVLGVRAGVSGFTAQGMDPVEGTGATAAFLCGAVSPGATPLAIAFSDPRAAAQPPLGPGAGTGFGPAGSGTSGSGLAAGAGAAASSARDGAGRQQPGPALRAAPELAPQAPSSSARAAPTVALRARAYPEASSSAQPAVAEAAAPPGRIGSTAAAPPIPEPLPRAPAAPGPPRADAEGAVGGAAARAGSTPSGQAGAAAGTPAGSCEAAGQEGPGVGQGWRFSACGLLDAMTVQLLMQTVGCILDRDTVDELVGSGAGEWACLLQRRLGTLSARELAQLLDPAVLVRLLRELQVLVGMGLIAAEGCEPSARAGAPPAPAPTYICAGLVELEEPAELAHPWLMGKSLDVLMPAGPHAPRPAPEAPLTPEELVNGGFRRRVCEYALREAGDADMYWTRMEFLCTLWREQMAFCIPAKQERGAVSTAGWGAQPLWREEAPLSPGAPGAGAGDAAHRALPRHRPRDGPALPHGAPHCSQCICALRCRCSFSFLRSASLSTAVSR